MNSRAPEEADPQTKPILSDTASVNVSYRKRNISVETKNRNVIKKLHLATQNINAEPSASNLPHIHLLNSSTSEVNVFPMNGMFSPNRMTNPSHRHQITSLGSDQFKSFATSDKDSSNFVAAALGHNKTQSKLYIQDMPSTNLPRNAQTRAVSREKTNEFIRAHKQILSGRGTSGRNLS